MKDTLNDFIKETFSGKKPLIDQLNDEIKTIDGLTRTVERINKGLTEHLDMESKVLLKWIDKCSVLEGKLLQKDAEIALLNEALEVACEEVENEDNRGVCPDFNHDINWPECIMKDSPHDKGVCWKKYFLLCGQENIDREKNNKEVKNEKESVG